jgi:hypothetical protein
MMSETIEQSRGHLWIAEHARPFAKSEVGRDNHRGPFVEAADHVEQKLSASLSERQIAKLIEDDEVEAGEIIGEATLAARPSFGLKPVDQIDGVEEPATRSGSDTTARDRHRQMRLARSGPADQDDVALLSDEATVGEIAHQALIDRCPFELEAVDILGKWQFGDGQLVFDRTRLLLRDLGLQQIARESLRFMLPLDRRREDLVPRVWLRQPEDRLRRSSCRRA